LFFVVCVCARALAFVIAFLLSENMYAVMQLRTHAHRYTPQRPASYAWHATQQ